MAVEKYPLDFDLLDKGQRIEVDELERTFGHKRGTTRYKFSLLALRERVEKELALRGKVVTVRTNRDALVICSDADAATYNDEAASRSWRRVKRSHVRNLGVDASKLAEEGKKEHDRNLIVWGGMIVAGEKARRQLALTGSTHQRQTPALPKPEGDGKEVKTDAIRIDVSGPEATRVEAK